MIYIMDWPVAVATVVCPMIPSMARMPMVYSIAIWCMVYSMATWCMVDGMVDGLWSMVYGI